MENILSLWAWSFWDEVQDEIQTNPSQLRKLVDQQIKITSSYPRKHKKRYFD